MTSELANFAARLRKFILSEGRVPRDPDSGLQSSNGGSCNSPLRDFNSLALELFALQFKHNAAYRIICESRLPRRSVAKAGGLTPKNVEHWTQIPAGPTAAFKELELTCLPPNERTAVFHSSGTTEQKPSRHYHSAESLAVYETSLWPWFQANVAIGAPNSDSACFQLGIVRADSEIGAPSVQQFQLIILTPPPAQAPHSSLVHMFETVRQKIGASESVFIGKITADGSWTLDFAAIVDALSPRRQPASPKHEREGGTPDAKPQTPACLAEGRTRRRDSKPLLLLGTAFSFVHLLDFLEEKNLRFDLPAGSRVMETGGYKNRSRSMPKAELHALITERLGIPPENIVCEYGMSELSSQAYNSVASDKWHGTGDLGASRHPSPVTRHFEFPPWARVQIVSPESGREVADGETGLIRVFDLANVFSVVAIQTEDLGIRRGDGFELIGRAQLAEPRGCSLMTA
ncbi:MAG: hypothetical protein ABSD57_08560 [Verrucomicrobiota bacterium]